MQRFTTAPSQRSRWNKPDSLIFWTWFATFWICFADILDLVRWHFGAGSLKFWTWFTETLISFTDLLKLVREHFFTWFTDLWKPVSIWSFNYLENRTRSVQLNLPVCQIIQDRNARLETRVQYNLSEICFNLGSCKIKTDLPKTLKPIIL